MLTSPRPSLSNKTEVTPVRKFLTPACVPANLHTGLWKREYALHAQSGEHNHTTPLRGCCMGVSYRGEATVSEAL